jgi:hypothetical protein
MDLWLAVLVVCLGAECALYPDNKLTQDKDACEERVMNVTAAILQAAPQAVTIGGCVKLPLKVS